MSKILISNTDDQTTINQVCHSCGFNNFQGVKFCIQCGILLKNSRSVHQSRILHPVF